MRRRGEQLLPRDSPHPRDPMTQHMPGPFLLMQYSSGCLCKHVTVPF